MSKVNTEVFVYKPVCFSAFHSFSTLCPLCKLSIFSYQKYLGKKHIKEFHCSVVSNHKIDLLEREVFQHEKTKIGLHSKVQC